MSGERPLSTPGALRCCSREDTSLRSPAIEDRAALACRVRSIATSLRITATSPTVDAGLPQPGLTCDFNGVARDALPDVGAFEYAVDTMP
jgi:hypothetical protein